MKTESIQDYILKNPRNFRIGAAVGEAWPEARQRLVEDFLSRLAARLQRSLRGWKCAPYGGQFFIEAYPGFYVEKQNWRDRCVGIQANEYGERMVIGIARGTDNTRKLPPHEPLLSAIQEFWPAAKAHAWWEARYTMQSPATDWRAPEVLWRMKTDRRFLEEVADQIVRIAKAGERIIDRLEQKK